MPRKAGSSGEIGLNCGGIDDTHKANASRLGATCEARKDRNYHKRCEELRPGRCGVVIADEQRYNDCPSMESRKAYVDNRRRYQ